jgi:hypothetical protein
MEAVGRQSQPFEKDLFLSARSSPKSSPLKN